MDTNQAFSKLWYDFEKSGLKPANLLFTENNALVIAGGVNNFVCDFRRMPQPHELKSIIDYCGDIEQGGALQYHHGPQVQQAAPAPLPNPAERLPFGEIRELSFLKTVEDVKKFQSRVEKDGSSYMSGFRRLRPNSTKDYEELNARIAYIIEHKLHAPKVEAAPQPVLTPGQTLIAEAHALVDAMNLGDVGMTGSSAGRHTLLARKQERLHGEINQARRDGVNSQVILQRTKDDIKNFGSSSIR